ncbi:MAG: hypothetical protein B7733_06605 [Myxococcales bacterium FL481]|nr:MAG: hypothetical protein B7733_06605 [Myxococcales bacterium FL481]
MSHGGGIGGIEGRDEPLYLPALVVVLAGGHNVEVPLVDEQVAVVEVHPAVLILVGRSEHLGEVDLAQRLGGVGGSPRYDIEVGISFPPVRGHAKQVVARDHAAVDSRRDRQVVEFDRSVAVVDVEGVYVLFTDGHHDFAVEERATRSAAGRGHGA